MSFLGEILNGYSNYFKGSEDNTELAKERATICAECPLAKKGLHAAILPDASIGEIQGLYCGDCGCPLSPKVRSEQSKCPQGKW